MIIVLVTIIMVVETIIIVIATVSMFISIIITVIATIIRITVITITFTTYDYSYYNRKNDFSNYKKYGYHSYKYDHLNNIMVIATIIFVTATINMDIEIVLKISV